MTLGLHNLKKSTGSTHRKKRVGRGNASTGTYSGRGMKGQRSRSGGKKGLTAKGVKGYILRIPKKRGFRSLKEAPVAINLESLEKLFANGEIVTAKKLFKAGLLKKSARTYKILSKGKLSKKLTVQAYAFSKTARQAIVNAGGQIETLGVRIKTAKKK